MNSIRARLLVGLLIGTVCSTLAAAVLLYRLADHEADEQSDLRLRQVAWALPLHPDDGQALQLSLEADPDDAVYAQVWDGHDRPVYHSPQLPALPRAHGRGYRTVDVDGARWRVYGELRGGYVVQTSQPIAVRQRIAAHMALRIAPPLLLLLPVLAALIWVVVGRALGPLERVARAVRGRSATALQPLDEHDLPPELRPIVVALNGLLGQIAHAMAAQSNFVADAAHELRSPLTALKLQLQLAERATSEESRLASFRKLHERLDRSTHLVQQLLTLARQEQAPSDRPAQPCDLLALANAVVGEAAIHAESRSVALRLAVHAASARIAGYHEGLFAMLSNLVDNALRYTQPGGHVDVACGMEGAQCYVRVTDDGPGVPAAERDRLFDRFYRPDGNTVSGCGLGLSIVKSVADRHGALLKLGEGADGRGLSVTVLFPSPPVTL